MKLQEQYDGDIVQDLKKLAAIAESEFPEEDERHAFAAAVLAKLEIADPYAELKAAHAAGKVIEWRIAGENMWMEKVANFDQYPSNCEYRIKPDEFPPAPEAGPSIPRIMIQCETSDGFISGSTRVEPDRVDVEDDGSLSVVTTKLWPEPAKPEAVDPYAELRKAQAAGKTIQYKGFDELWHDPTSPYEFSWPPERYRVKPEEFPAAPEGAAWHNPDNLTPEQVGVSAGWRLLLVDEHQRGDNVEGQWWNSDYWTGTDKWKFGPAETIRTKRPLPTPPKLIPLTADDIPPGSVLRKNFDGVSGWIAITYVSPEFVIARELHINYRELHHDGWQIKRPNEDWMPCHKEG